MTIGEMIAVSRALVAPLAATAGTLAERTVEVDPRLLIGFNKLTMTLIAAPGSDAAAGAEAPGLWADIAVSSELELTLQPLVLADDLAILPEPFFDSHDRRRVVVPFAFGAKPSQATLRAAPSAIGRSTWRTRGVRPSSTPGGSTCGCRPIARRGAAPAFRSR